MTDAAEEEARKLVEVLNLQRDRERDLALEMDKQLREMLDARQKREENLLCTCQPLN